MSELTARLAVRHGVRFLDAQLGRVHWLARVDGEELYTADSITCPLAQATGEEYWVAARHYGMSEETRYGALLAASRGFLRGFGNSYAELDCEWRRVITRLKLELSRADSVRITA